MATNLLLRTKRRYEADIALMHQVADTLIAERRRDPEAATRHDLLNLMLEGATPRPASASRTRTSATRW